MTNLLANTSPISSPSNMAIKGSGVTNETNRLGDKQKVEDMDFTNDYIEH